jgi:hypothetical protein
MFVFAAGDQGFHVHATRGSFPGGLIGSVKMRSGVVAFILRPCRRR